jgi:hypothetical protein
MFDALRMHAIVGQSVVCSDQAFRLPQRVDDTLQRWQPTLLRYLTRHVLGSTQVFNPRICMLPSSQGMVIRLGHRLRATKRNNRTGGCGTGSESPTLFKINAMHELFRESVARNV